MEAGMLRKMEKGVAEETSLLEFIKSKGLALKGEGDWGHRGRAWWVKTTKPAFSS